MKTIKFALLLLFVVPALTFAKGLQVRVIDVHDGDTVTGVGVEDSKKYKVRLIGVDTPEVEFFKYDQGEAATDARDALKAMLPKDTVIEIADDSDIDRHGRVLGVVLKNGVDINKEMLRQGWGFIYFIYPFEKRRATAYSQAAYEGIEKQRGLFAQNRKETEEPYLFRMRVRHQEGHNPVGDIETKELFSPKDVAQIPVWRRVFFPNEESAHKMGYH